ncbi:MAG: hypothetical protein KAW12_19500 [Candidatus Aminicenantes bacterium]|nr:hypothetical protein [Candidatus Aminicenantes bacterium]
MKLPENTLIAREKPTRYLLVQKKRNDKSQWLARAGYTLDNWQILETDLRNQILSIDAGPIERTGYGRLYEINGQLVGPNGKILSVRSIWMTERATGDTKFITMYPAREEDK